MGIETVILIVVVLYIFSLLANQGDRVSGDKTTYKRTLLDTLIGWYFNALVYFTLLGALENGRTAYRLWKIALQLFEDSYKNKGNPILDAAIKAFKEVLNLPESGLSQPQVNQYLTKFTNGMRKAYAKAKQQSKDPENLNTDELIKSAIDLLTGVGVNYTVDGIRELAEESLPDFNIVGFIEDTSNEVTSGDKNNWEFEINSNIDAAVKRSKREIDLTQLNQLTYRYLSLTAHYGFEINHNNYSSERKPASGNYIQDFKRDEAILKKIYGDAYQFTEYYEKYR